MRLMRLTLRCKDVVDCGWRCCDVITVLSDALTPTVHTQSERAQL